MVMKIVKVDQLPGVTMEADTLYLKRNQATQDFEVHVTDSTASVLYPLSGTYTQAEIAQVAQEGAFKQPDRLLVYYGHPSAYKGLWDIAKVAADMAAHYDIVILGNGYQDPTHEDHANTVAIASLLAAKGVKVYGYISTGVSTSNLTLQQIVTRINQWVHLVGVHGIFLDEFGFDYGNTRARQQEIVMAVRAAGKVYAANAWGFSDVLCTNISEIPYPDGHWTKVNFAAKNPNNLPLDFGVGDAYVLESFLFSHTGPMDIFAGFEYYTKVRDIIHAVPGRDLWCLGVFAEVAGQADTTKIGNFTQVDDAVAYIWAGGLALDAAAVGIGGYSYGANGTIISSTPYRLPALSFDRGEYSYNPNGTPTVTRNYGEMAIKLTNNNSGVLGLEIIDNRKAVLSGVYPRAAAPDYVTQAELNALLADIQAALAQINGV